MVVQRAEGKTDKRLSSTKMMLPGWNWGSPLLSDLWCSVLENQTVETFPCYIFYCLLHLGQRLSFRPELSVILLLPELLRLGGLQSELGDSCPLTGEARFKSWFWQTSTMLQSPWGWHLIHCCWLCTLTLPWIGARTKIIMESKFWISL